MSGLLIPPARIRAAAVTILLIAIAAVYAPVAGYDFVNYDDDHFVYANETVKAGVTRAGVRSAFTGTTVGHWVPLTTLSHMLDVELFGLHAGRHHLVNVAVHALNAVLLLLVLTSLTGSPSRSAIVAALFALHPINVETVAWITQRKSLLSTTMWLAAIAAYASWVHRRRMLDFALLVAAFAAGLMFKAMIVTLPATLLVLDLWPLRRVAPAAVLTADGRRTIGRLILEKLPLFVLAGLSSAGVILTQRAADALTPAAQFPLRERLLNACVSYLWYIQKTVVPAGLTVVNPHPSGTGALVSRPLALLSLLVLVSIAVLALRSIRRRPYLTAGVGWYAVTLLPVSGIIQVGGNAQGDHFGYVPLIGIFVAAVWLLADLAQEWGATRPALAAAAGIALVFAVLARAQLATWRNSETLFLRAMQVHDGQSFIARKNLAAHYSDLAHQRKLARDPAGALPLYEAATQLNPDAGVLYNHAAILSDLQRYREAAVLYERSLALQPDNADAWLNLGDAQVMTGQYAAAAASYRRTIALRPDKYAFYGLAFACAKLEDGVCATGAFETLQSIDPPLARELALQIGRG